MFKSLDFDFNMLSYATKTEYITGSWALLNGEGKLVGTTVQLLMHTFLLDFGPKLHHQYELTMLVFGMFWLRFSTVGGRGDIVPSLFIPLIHHHLTRG